MNTFKSTLVLLCITLSACKPVHHLQKRTAPTLSEIVGDLTAEEEGILNNDSVPMSDCYRIYNESGGLAKSGIYTINPNDCKGEFNVFCDMNLRDGGWTVIQRRVDDTVSFNRKRHEYNVGFGSFNGNLWLGLEKIKRITDTGTYELYIGLQSYYGSPSDLAWEKYASFSLGADDIDYTLTLSVTGNDFEGTAGNGMKDHNGKKFSTPDEDNDPSVADCAGDFSSGWWYDSCREAHLNGVYYGSASDPPAPAVQDGILWNTWLDEIPLQTVVMAVRPT